MLGMAAVADADLVVAAGEHAIALAGAVGERAHDQAADGEAVGGHVAGEGAVPRARDLEQQHEADAEHGGARALQEAAHDEHRHLQQKELQNWKLFHTIDSNRFWIPDYYEGFWKITIQ